MRLATLSLALLCAVAARAEGPWHGACVLHLDGWEGRYDPEAARALFRRLEAAGASAVALSAFAWQDDLAATTLRPWDGDPRARAELAAAVRDAHAAGLAVLLKPHVEIGRQGRRVPGAWRGHVRFESATEARSWFASYRSFVVDLARLAAQTRVEVLAIGLELAGLSRDWPDEWARLVREVRAEYSGRLTYCANWWGELGELELWARLDLIGIQAFAPLSASPSATAAELRRGARETVASWRKEAERWGKPVIVSEFGFKSSPAPWVEPWEWGTGPARPMAQVRAYRALLGEMAAQREGWLAGSFAWLFEASGAADPEADGGFSPDGKPAMSLLVTWWAGRDAPE
jgi:hypothetical protein